MSSLSLHQDSNFSLPSLIRKYETVICPIGVVKDGMKPVKLPICQPLVNTAKDNVFSIDFVAALINQTDHVYEMDWLFRKVIVRPELTMGLMCHYAQAQNQTASGVVVVPPKSGFIAHYRIHNFSEELLSRAKRHASEMMDDY
jgi:hypothetical protein